MTDPAIESESGESYKMLYERLMRVYLDTLRQIRELLDRSVH